MLYPTLSTISKSQNAGMQLLLVTAEDLREFARDIAREVREQTEPSYFTRKQLLEYLGVSARTLWEYEDAGIISSKKVGAKKLYNKAEIREAIEDGLLRKPKTKKT